MPMDRTTPIDPLSKAEFHKRLRAWLDTDELTIGGIDAGSDGWVYVRDGEQVFQLNADTTREGVDSYLALLDAFEWTMVPDSRGRNSAIAYGPQKHELSYFYLYDVER